MKIAFRDEVMHSSPLCAQPLRAVSGFWQHSRNRGRTTVVRESSFPVASGSGERAGETASALPGRRECDTHIEVALDIGAVCRELFEGIADALLLMTPDGIVLHINGAASALLGYVPEELAGRHVSLLYPASEAGRIDACFKELRSGSSTRYSDGLATTRDGETVAVDVVGSRISFAARDLVIAVVRDIRERKRTEAELQAAQQRFYLLAEHIREIFWIGDPHTRTLHYASPAFTELCTASGTTHPDNLGAWVQAVVPPDRPRFENFLAAQAQGEPVQVEVRVADSAGNVRWLHCRAFPWQAEDGQERVAGVAEDVTAHKQAEAIKLAEAERQGETLLREAHHRIKNSLQGVVGLLRRCAGQHPALAQVLTAAISQVRSIAVIHDLQGSHAAAPVRLGELLRMIASSIEGLFDVRFKVELNELFTGGLRLADGDAVPLAIALNELLMNAAKHACGAGSGPETEQIEVELSAGDGCALIAICNSGQLPPDFDFVARRGLGQGLELLLALLPAGHASLEFSQQGSRVLTHLTLLPPLITFNETADHAQRRRPPPATASG